VVTRVTRRAPPGDDTSCQTGRTEGGVTVRPDLRIVATAVLLAGAMSLAAPTVALGGTGPPQTTYVGSQLVTVQPVSAAEVAALALREVSDVRVGPTAAIVTFDHAGERSRLSVDYADAVHAAEARLASGGSDGLLRLVAGLALRALSAMGKLSRS
jgi:hypothetical protein